MMHLGNITIAYSILCELFHILFDTDILATSLVPIAYLLIHPADDVHSSLIMPCLLFLIVILLTPSLRLLYMPPLLDKTIVSLFDPIDIRCAKI